MREGVKTTSVGTTRQSIRISVTSIAHRDYFASKCSSTWLIWFTVHCGQERKHCIDLCWPDRIERGFLYDVELEQIQT